MLFGKRDLGKSVSKRKWNKEQKSLIVHFCFTPAFNLFLLLLKQPNTEFQLQLKTTLFYLLQSLGWGIFYVISISIKTYVMTVVLFSQSAFNSYYFTYWLLSTEFDTGKDTSLYLHIFMHLKDKLSLKYFLSNSSLKWNGGPKLFLCRKGSSQWTPTVFAVWYQPTGKSACTWWSANMHKSNYFR